mgnify:FL=1
MKEQELRDDLRQTLGRDGWIVWFARRMKFVKAQDVFTIWDGLKAKGNKLIPLQFTTKENASSHRTKIKEYKELYGLTHKGELWLWNRKKREWEVEII